MTTVLFFTHAFTYCIFIHTILDNSDIYIYAHTLSNCLLPAPTLSHTLLTRTGTRVHPAQSRNWRGTPKGLSPTSSAPESQSGPALPPAPPHPLMHMQHLGPAARPQTAICGGAGGCVRQALRSRVEERAPRPPQLLAVAVP